MTTELSSNNQHCAALRTCPGYMKELTFSFDRMFRDCNIGKNEEKYKRVKDYSKTF